MYVELWIEKSVACVEGGIRYTHTGRITSINEIFSLTETILILCYYYH